MATSLKDYLSQRKGEKESALTAEINRDIKSELSRRRGVIEGGREEFKREEFKRELQAALSRAGVRGEAGAGESLQREFRKQLEQPLERKLGEREFEAETQRLNLLYQQAFRLAVVEGGANLQQAKDYAIKVVESQRQRDAFEQEQQAQRESTSRLVEQEEDFTRRSLASYGQSLEQDIDYGQLVTGALSRLGGNIVGYKTAQYLDRSKEKKKGIFQIDTNVNGSKNVYPQYKQSDRLTYSRNVG